MQIKRTIASVLASGALILNAFSTPALAATTLEISGNGSNSDSTANVSVSNNTTVVQSNNADINNDVNVDADTGHNDANDNTGGDVTIDTGDATTDVAVSNTVNSNTASVDCCDTGDTDVLISGNGTHSDNNVNLDNNHSTTLYQTNNADIDNDVDVDSDTGYNDAEDNTGGDVSITTGDVDTSVTLSTVANANVATVGGNGGEGGTLSARIIGNGSNSDNDIDLDLTNDVLLVQSNDADVDNDVDVDSDTGDNDADDNTNGDVMIDTGDATTDVTIDNALNFNFADADCGCLLDDVLAKIAGNGTDSDNDIKATLDGSQEVYQDNCGDEVKDSFVWDVKGSDCGVDNDVDVDSDTGYNDAEDNTGGVDADDPSLETGDADTTVDLTNAGNVNSYGSDFELPGGLNLNLTFDLDDLLDMLAGH